MDSIPQIDLILILASIFMLVLLVFVFAFAIRSRLDRRGQGALEKIEAAVGLLKWAPHLESRYIECGGERIHYIQTGQGPHLVLLHGIGASIFIWRFVIARLAEHYTVTALDLPGFGRSSKRPRDDYGLDKQHERVLDFLDALNIKTAHLAGSSMGGTIALWMARQDPQRFSEVAVLAPATNPTIIPRRLSRLAALTPYAHRTVNRSTMKLILRQVMTRSDLIYPDTIETYLEPYLDDGVSVRTFLAAMELLGDPRLPKCFAGLQSRVLIVYGKRDRMVSHRSVRRLIALIPHAELEAHASAGHHIMEDEADWVADRLLQFFSRHSSARQSAVKNPT